MPKGNNAPGACEVRGLENFFKEIFGDSKIVCNFASLLRKTLPEAEQRAH